jgi:hypothetical protein
VPSSAGRAIGPRRVRSNTERNRPDFEKRFPQAREPTEEEQQKNIRVIDAWFAEHGYATRVGEE